MTDHKKTIPQWITFFRKIDIPILKLTSKALAALKADEDSICAKSISMAVINDPMMVFRVLSYAQKHKGRHQVQDLLQVEQAVMMLGTNTFYRELAPKVFVDQLLSSNLKALTQVLKLIKRAHRGAYFATEFAVYHNDVHAGEIHIAALLHDLAEILLWCFAPTDMEKIYTIQHANKTYRSADVQASVLGFTLHDLQAELVRAFELPPLLSKLMDDDFADDRRVKHVTLAVNFVHHSSNGWHDAALPDDYQNIANFLRIDVERTKRVLGAPATEAMR